jgi:hypothetical protein
VCIFALKRSAESDNDKIYLQPVVKSEDLPLIFGVAMVKETTIYDLDALKRLGYVSEPFFKTLVPYAVHREASAFFSKKDIELNAIREIIESDSATCLSYFFKLFI